MTQDKKSNERSRVSIITHIRSDVLQIHPRHFFLTILHTIAMNCPIFKLRNVFYRMRGTRIEKNVTIANHVFMDDLHPELILIKEKADLGPRVMILAYDTVLGHLYPGIPPVTSEVTIGRNCYLGAGVIILPGVTIGDNSIIGAGAVVTKSIPPESVAMGVPAKVVSTREEWSRKHLVDK